MQGPTACGERPKNQDSGQERQLPGQQRAAKSICHPAGLPSCSSTARESPQPRLQLQGTTGLFPTPSRPGGKPEVTPNSALPRCSPCPATGSSQQRLQLLLPIPGAPVLVAVTETQRELMSHSSVLPWYCPFPRDWPGSFPTPSPIRPKNSRAVSEEGDASAGRGGCRCQGDTRTRQMQGMPAPIPWVTLSSPPHPSLCGDAASAPHPAGLAGGEAPALQLKQQLWWLGDRISKHPERLRLFPTDPAQSLYKPLKTCPL